jgi:hypothetical protein
MLLQVERLILQTSSFERAAAILVSCHANVSRIGGRMAADHFSTLINCIEGLRRVCETTIADNASTTGFCAPDILTGFTFIL